MQNLTVIDIAKRIQRPDETVSAASHRLRNWTKMGIIEPVAEYRPGVRRWRHYDNKALLKAVVIQILVDAVGAPAITLNGFAGTVARMLSGVNKRSQPPSLIMYASASGATNNLVGFVTPEELAKYSASSEFDSIIVLDIKRILERTELLRDSKPAEGGGGRDGGKAFPRLVRIVRRKRRD